MINCHINGKPMADLLALYEQEKEKNKKLEEEIGNWKFTAKYVEDNCISKYEITQIRDKAEVMDYYTLNNVIDDLSKLIGDYKDE